MHYQSNNSLPHLEDHWPLMEEDLENMVVDMVEHMLVVREKEA